MQRKVTGGAVSFKQNWIKYRNGFGSPTSDNYWLGLDKVYRLTQMGVARLRIEVIFAAIQLLAVLSVRLETSVIFAREYAASARRYFKCAVEL